MSSAGDSSSSTAAAKVDSITSSTSNATPVVLEQITAANAANAALEDADEFTECNSVETNSSLEIVLDKNEFLESSTLLVKNDKGTSKLMYDMVDKHYVVAKNGQEDEYDLPTEGASESCDSVPSKKSGSDVDEPLETEILFDLQGKKKAKNDRKREKDRRKYRERKKKLRQEMALGATAANAVVKDEPASSKDNEEKEQTQLGLPEQNDRQQSSEQDLDKAVDVSVSDPEQQQASSHEVTTFLPSDSTVHFKTPAPLLPSVKAVAAAGDTSQQQLTLAEALLQEHQPSSLSSPSAQSIRTDALTASVAKGVALITEEMEEKEQQPLKLKPVALDPDYIKFYYQQEAFVNDVEQIVGLQSLFSVGDTVSGSHKAEQDFALDFKPIESDDELIDRQKQLAKREEAVIEQVKSSGYSTTGDAAVQRSDSFEQLIRDTAGGGGGGENGDGAPKQPQFHGGGNLAVHSTAEDSDEAHRKTFIFYAALVVAIAVLLANKYFF